MQVSRYLVAIVVLVGVCAVAPAADFFDGFESYATGSALHGQGGWKGWDNTAGAGAPASSAQAYSGSKSVEIVGSADLIHEFDASGGLWEFTAMQYLPSGTTGETFFILLNQYNDGGPYDWSVQINFNLGTGTVTSENLGSGTASIVYDRWIELKFVIDLTNNTVDEYYGGELLSSHQWDNDNHGTIGAIDLYGNGASSVYYDDIDLQVNKEASGPAPEDKSIIPDTYGRLMWTAGATAASHDLYFGTDADAVLAGTAETFVKNLTDIWFIVGLGMVDDPLPGGLEHGTTYYWRVDAVEADGVTKHVGDVWSFTRTPLTAYGPRPADGMTLVDLDETLTWEPGWGPVFHRVHFGTDYDTIANAAAGTGQVSATPSFDPPGTLQPDTTYYWRVDESTTTDDVRRGDVWSFTTKSDAPGGLLAEYFSYAQGTSPAQPFTTFLVSLIEPEINFNWGSGSTPGTHSPDPLVPVEGFSARWTGEVIIPIGDTYTFYGSSDDGMRIWVNDTLVMNAWVDRGTTETSGKIALEAGVYPIEVHYYENGGGATAALSWECSYIPKEIIPEAALVPPIKASRPRPGNGATGVNRLTDLKWSEGIYAVSHDVYFGTDAAAVAGATKASTEFQISTTLSAKRYDPGTLDLAQTYYWRIDEVNASHPDSPWKGNLWSFTVGDFLTLDDVEDYNNYDPDRIFDTWTDGTIEPGIYGGSQVGYWLEQSDLDAGETFVETDIVHNGEQSMPFFYDNSGNIKHSEAKRALGPELRDWTKEGVKALSLWYYGYPESQGGVQSNSAEPMYVKIKDGQGRTATVPNPDPAAANVTTWTEWGEYGQGIALSEFTAKTPGLNLANIVEISIGFGTPGNTQPGGTGLVFFDDIRLHKPRCIPELAKPAGDLSGNCVVDMADLDVLTDQWLSNGPGLSADLNADETVDFSDYAVMVGDWLDEQLWP